MTEADASADEDAHAGADAGATRPSLPIDDSLFFELARVVSLTARPFSR